LLSQQVPSTQKPLAHSASAVHDAPCFAKQVPFAVALAEHDLSAPQSVTPQHTPSVQNNPSRQSPADVQAAPRESLGTHAPPLHELPAAQSAFVAHEVLQAVVLHAKGAQLREVSVHLPTPSHLPTLVSTPELQASAPHAAVVVGK
jgi:hypothetical protein